jgi:hypothetical protein
MTEDYEPWRDADTGEVIDCVRAGDSHIERAIDTQLTGERRCLRCGKTEPAQAPGRS